MSDSKEHISGGFMDYGDLARINAIRKRTTGAYVAAVLLSPTMARRVRAWARWDGKMGGMLVDHCAIVKAARRQQVHMWVGFVVSCAALFLWYVSTPSSGPDAEPVGLSQPLEEYELSEIRGASSDMGTVMHQESFDGGDARFEGLSGRRFPSLPIAVDGALDTQPKELFGSGSQIEPSETITFTPYSTATTDPRAEDLSEALRTFRARQLQGESAKPAQIRTFPLPNEFSGTPYLLQNPPKGAIEGAVDKAIDFAAPYWPLEKWIAFRKHPLAALLITLVSLYLLPDVLKFAIEVLKALLHGLGEFLGQLLNEVVEFIGGLFDLAAKLSPYVKSAASTLTFGAYVESAKDSVGRAGRSGGWSSAQLGWNAAAESREVMYAGNNPLVGFGWRLSEWAHVVDLTRGSDGRPASGLPLHCGGELYSGIASRISAIPSTLMSGRRIACAVGATEDGASTGTTDSGGTGGDADEVDLVLEVEDIEEFDKKFQLVGEADHAPTMAYGWATMVVGTIDAAVTTAWRVQVVGSLLRVEVEHRYLPPPPSPRRAGDAWWGLRRLFSLVYALLLFPIDLLLGLVTFMGDCVAHIGETWSEGLRVGNFPGGARISLRELLAESDPQALSIHPEVASAVQMHDRAIVAAIEAFLNVKQVDSSDIRGVSTNIFNISKIKMDGSFLAIGNSGQMEVKGNSFSGRLRSVARSLTRGSRSVIS